MIVILPYTRTLVDELDLVPGTVLVILDQFDDGWAKGRILGVNGREGEEVVDVGREGLFPLACVASL